MDHNIYLYNKVLALDENAFDALYDEFHNLIWYLAKQKINCNEDIVDLELKIFEKIFKNVDNVKRPESFKAYVASIINNEILLMCKTLKRENCILVDEEKIDYLITNNTSQNSFDELIAYLEPFERVVIINKFVLCMGISQIAKSVNLSEMKVRRIINDCLNKIREGLDKDGYYVRRKSKLKINER